MFESLVVVGVSALDASIDRKTQMPTLSLRFRDSGDRSSQFMVAVTFDTKAQAQAYADAINSVGRQPTLNQQPYLERGDM